MNNNRLFDKLIPKLIEYAIVIGMVYGGIRVTVSYLQDDVRDNKSDIKALCLKVNTLEANYVNIMDELKDIKKIARGKYK